MTKETLKTPTRKQIFAAAMKLEARTWRVLFDLLLADIEVEPDPEIEAAWLEVVTRRMKETNAQDIPGDVVMARAREVASKPGPARSNIWVGSLELTTSQVIDACRSLPVEERIALAGRYLADLRDASGARADSRWLTESERWLSRARTALRVKH